MPTDSLKELLQQADRAAGPPPPLPDDLEMDAQRAALLRRRRRVLLAGAAAAVLLAAGVSVSLRGVSPAGLGELLPSPAQVADARLDAGQRHAELVRLRSSAELHEAVARRLEELREDRARLAQLQDAAALPDPVAEAQRQMEKAALTLVHSADRMYRELESKTVAIETFHEAIRLFPETSWAAVAQYRLNEIETEKGDTL